MKDNLTPQVVQDIVPPAKTTEPASEGLIKTEMEQGIPVRQPSQTPRTPDANNSNPTASTKQFIEEDANKKDAELAKILQDVNKNAKKAQQKPKTKSKFLARQKNLNKKPETKKESTPKSTKPVLAVLVAMVVAIVLGVAAFYAFNQNT